MLWKCYDGRYGLSCNVALMGGPHVGGIKSNGWVSGGGS
jgi:hypothetical protein